MSFLALGSSTCFLCGRVIAARVEAAQLEYASPDDVGDVARHGRAWVHRACWRSWPMRDAWRGSTRRLMAAQPGMTAVRDAIARRARGDALLTDVGAPLSIAVPLDQIAAVCAALRAAHPTTLEFGHAGWQFSPAASAVRLTATHDGAPFEDLLIEDPDAWWHALDALRPR